jgi:hypothetical protein
MIATEEAVIYLKLQHLRAPKGTQRKTRNRVPWIFARELKKEPSYFTDQAAVAVKLCICTRDTHISNQKGD